MKKVLITVALAALSTTAFAEQVVYDVVITPTIVPITRTGWGPPPMRPHFTERNSNSNVKAKTNIRKNGVADLADAVLNGTAGLFGIFIPTSNATPQVAPVQPIIVKPIQGW